MNDIYIKNINFELIEERTVENGLDYLNGKATIDYIVVIDRNNKLEGTIEMSADKVDLMLEGAKEEIKQDVRDMLKEADSND